MGELGGLHGGLIRLSSGRSGDNR